MEKKELIKSQIDRQNILNNEYAIEEIMNAFDFDNISFEGKINFLKLMLEQLRDILKGIMMN